jgi:acyl-coenzyme A thioesterase PaaI-like protein
MHGQSPDTLPGQRPDILQVGVPSDGLSSRRRLRTMSERDEQRVPPHHDPACWGCGDNPFGIHLRTPEAEGQIEYESYVEFDERHQAAPGLVHGGLVAAALDEACGLLASWYRFPTVTGRLFVNYRLPVPINTELLLRARVDDKRGRRIHVTGELVDGDDVLAEARAAFIHVPLEHFLGTPEGQEAAEAWRRRLADE